MTRSIVAQHAKEDGSSLSVDEQLCHAPQGPHMLFPRPSKYPEKWGMVPSHTGTLPNCSRYLEGLGLASRVINCYQ